MKGIARRVLLALSVSIAWAGIGLAQSPSPSPEPTPDAILDIVNITINWDIPEPSPSPSPGLGGTYDSIGDIKVSLYEKPGSPTIIGSVISCFYRPSGASNWDDCDSESVDSSGWPTLVIDFLAIGGVDPASSHQLKFEASKNGQTYATTQETFSKPTSASTDTVASFWGNPGSASYPITNTFLHSTKYRVPYDYFDVLQMDHRKNFDGNPIFLFSASAVLDSSIYRVLRSGSIGDIYSEDSIFLRSRLGEPPVDPAEVERAKAFIEGSKKRARP